MMKAVGEAMNPSYKVVWVYVPKDSKLYLRTEHKLSYEIRYPICKAKKAFVMARIHKVGHHYLRYFFQSPRIFC